jgi:hypothetical protein
MTTERLGLSSAFSGLFKELPRDDAGVAEFFSPVVGRIYIVRQFVEAETGTFRLTVTTDNYRMVGKEDAVESPLPPVIDYQEFSNGDELFNVEMSEGVPTVLESDAALLVPAMLRTKQADMQAALELREQIQILPRGPHVR